MIQKEFTCLRDGLVIRGTCYYNEGKNLPVAVVSHGFMDTRRGTRKYAKMLAEEGYLGVCFDFCGGGIGSKSDGESTDMSVLTEAEDLKAVIEKARTWNNADPDRVILMGLSQGGFVSALVAAELKEKIENLILFYPALCIPDDARKGKMMFAKFDPVHIPKTFRCGLMKLGRTYAKSVRKMDPYEILSAYQGPSLIIHGKKDKIVDISYSEKLKSVWGDNCVLKEIQNGNHGFSDKRADETAMEHVRQYLKGRREYLSVDVFLTGREVSEKDKKTKEYTLTLPFKGTVKNEFLTGGILPDAKDVQRRKGKKLLHAKADYFISGTDKYGNPCTVHVINENDGTCWKPRITTDSRVLSFLQDKELFAVLEGRKEGPIVHIYG